MTYECKRVPTVEKMVAWTDSCWMSVLADTPIVSFGPAAPDVVHGPNEYVEIDDIMSSAKAVALRASPVTTVMNKAAKHRHNGDKPETKRWNTWQAV
jgi:hypothetical protein